MIKMRMERGKWGMLYYILCCESQEREAFFVIILFYYSLMMIRPVVTCNGRVAGCRLGDQCVSEGKEEWGSVACGSKLNIPLILLFFC